MWKIGKKVSTSSSSSCCLRDENMKMKKDETEMKQGARENNNFD